MKYFILLVTLILIKQVTFSLSMPAPEPVNGIRCMALTPQCMGNNQSTRPSDFCYQCQYIQQQNWRFNMIPTQAPWWSPYGNYNYSNFYRPGAWYNHGLSNHYYPGQGNMVAGKPNLYFHGVEKDLRFVINFNNKANMLASAPIHNEDGWMLKKDRNKIVVNGNKYDYLYYDYKLDSHSLQSSRGFCGDRHSVFKKMVSALNEMKFKDKEVTDFEDYWSVKLPKGNFCVYPQSHDELQQIAQWNSSHAPGFFKRVLFVVVPEAILGTKYAANFKNRPSQGWNPISGVYRHPSSTNPLQVHEWGIAFLTTNKKK